jgi:two-component system, OmpR family, response regulator
MASRRSPLGRALRAIAATSALEALEIVKQVKPDLLISEISLPNEDGYSLMRKVKALENARQVEIPAMALTTYDGEDDRAHALSVGFEKHLPGKAEGRLPEAAMYG